MIRYSTDCQIMITDWRDFDIIDSENCDSRQIGLDPHC